ncbi:hypothetical protein TrST_g1356, partial [Triparma strigata]
MNDAGNGCSVCPNGKFSNPGSTSCSNCDETPGYVSLSGESRAAACEYCGPGFYADQTFHTCKECEIDSYSVGGVNECISCPSGTNNAVASTSCSPCPPGTISTGTSCDQCEKGKYGEFGATSCDPCDGDGQYADEFGLAACKTAPAGEKPTSDRQGVERYPAGKYSTGGEDECTECGSGETSDAGAAGCRTCTTCGTGKYKISDCSPGSETQCGDCPKNTFTISSAADINGCENCPVGGHSQPGAGYCDQCRSGKYYEEQSNSCEFCPAGKYTAIGGASINECLSCDDGFYNSDPGSSTCFTCTPGKFTNDDQTECLFCPVGKISGVAASSCSVCEEGKYAEGEGNTECQFCDNDEMLIGSITLHNGTTSASGCICPAGEYVHFNKNTCQNVPDGVETSIQAMTTKTLNVKPGYWRANASSSEILPCLSPEHCLGGPDPAAQCKEGHSGPLCAVCADGYASTGSGMFLKCSLCEGGDASTTIAVGFGGFFLVVFLMIGIACCCSKRKKKAGRDEGDEDYEEDDGAALSQNDSLDRVTGANKKLSKIDSLLSFYNEARPYGKVMLSYLQIAGGLSFNLDMNFPPMFIQLMGVVAAVVVPDFTQRRNEALQHVRLQDVRQRLRKLP